MDSGGIPEGSGLIPDINPYLQNIAENSIDDLTGKSNVYEQQMQQTSTYNMETNVEVHQGDNTYIQHNEYHQTTTVTTEVYQETIPVVTQANEEYMLVQGNENENVYVPETENVQEYQTEVVTDQTVDHAQIETDQTLIETDQTDSVVNGNEATTYVYEEPVHETYEVQETENTVETTEDHVVQEEPTQEIISEHITEEAISEEQEAPVDAQLIEDSLTVNEESVDNNLVIAENERTEEQKETVEESLTDVDVAQQENPAEKMDIQEVPLEYTPSVERSMEDAPIEEPIAQIEEPDTPIQEPHAPIEEPQPASEQPTTQPSEPQTEIIYEQMEGIVEGEIPEGSVVLTYDENEEFVDDPEPFDDTRSKSRSSTNSDNLEGKPRGRKHTSVPLHILGHHLEKPSDSVANGRPAKPRLGVKVPYRNLTSQIVSAEEIQKEIVERGRRKQAEVQGNSFSRQMTKRLASKLAGDVESGKDDGEMPQVEKLVESMQKEGEGDEGAVAEVSERSKMSKIRDNNDLLAILEGDGDDMPDDPSPDVDYEKARKEREIALKQLSDLPYLTPTPKHFKGRPKPSQAKPDKQEKQDKQDKEESESPTKTPERTEKVEKTEKKTEKPDPELFSSPVKPSNKENNSSKTTADKKEITKKIPIEVEPQIKVNMALKTYSRKRKSSEAVTPVQETKKAAYDEDIDVKPSKIDLPPDVYITKSSRVIKKKVIWDPDEARSPRPYSRSSDVGMKSPPATQSKAEKREKSVEKSTEKKVNVEKPKEETKKEEKKEKRVYERSPKKEVKEETVTEEKEKAPKKEVASLKKEAALPKKLATPPPEKIPKKEVPVEKTTTKKEVTHEKTPKKEEKIVKKETVSPEKPTPKRVPIYSPTKKTKAVYKPQKKSRSEVDKLLGDEGAIKMLYELKNDGEPSAKKKKEVLGPRSVKELRKRASELKSDLQNSTISESPKNLRKKDSKDNVSPAPPAASSPSPAVISPATKPQPVAASISRQKSKDSTRSSVHTPPPSPGFARNADTYLIRRRSSSSISSSDEQAEIPEEKPVKTAKRQSLETAQKPKKGKKKEVDTPLVVMGTEELEKIKKVVKRKDKNADSYEMLSILKSGKHFNLELHYDTKDPYCTVAVLKELTAALNKIAYDNDCHVVSLTSCTTAFCLGLPYKSLVSKDEKQVMNKAAELANCVRDYLLSLLHFPKILVAGVQGDCSGLAVTMLPLFDVVIASDTATFSTPYTALGCAAEAGFLLGLPQINRGFAANLLYTSNVQSADEALKGGLVSKLCWPEKYKDTFKSLLMSISKGSKQSLQSNKLQLRSTMLESTEKAIKASTDDLIAHWTSSECQKNFAVRIVGN